MHFISLLRLYSSESLVNNELKECGRKWLRPSFRYIIVLVWRDEGKPYKTNVQKKTLPHFTIWKFLHKSEFSTRVVNTILRPTGT
jgi:hypothetical protein